MVVPEDNDNCRVFFWRIRGVQGWQRDLWRFMYRNRLENCTGKYWNRIAWCWKVWRRTPAIMNTFINMTSVCPACAA